MKVGASVRKFPKVGSVQFFKLLILSSLALLVTVPLAFAIGLSVQNHRLQKTLAAHIADGVAMQNELAAQSALSDAISRGASDFHDLLAGFRAPVAMLPVDVKASSAASGSAMQLINSGAADKVVYLTFDDGPSVETGRILSVLDAAEVKATFFLTGKNVRERPSESKEIADRGHAIGLHGYSHNYAKTYASVESMLDDFNRAFEAIGAETGRLPGLIRFPGGSINPYNAGRHQLMISELLRRGFMYYDWNIDDGGLVKDATTQSVVWNVVSGVRRVKGSRVVLMHDIGLPITANALPQIIAQLRAEGYTFAPLETTRAPIVFAYKY